MTFNSDAYRNDQLADHLNKKAKNEPVNCPLCGDETDVLLHYPSFTFGKKVESCLPCKRDDDAIENARSITIKQQPQQWRPYDDIASTSIYIPL